jgi:hypothetical protein
MLDVAAPRVRARAHRGQRPSPVHLGEREALDPRRLWAVCLAPAPRVAHAASGAARHDRPSPRIDDLLLRCGRLHHHLRGASSRRAVLACRCALRSIERLEDLNRESMRGAGNRSRSASVSTRASWWRATSVSKPSSSEGEDDGDRIALLGRGRVASLSPDTDQGVVLLVGHLVVDELLLGRVQTVGVEDLGLGELFYGR